MNTRITDKHLNGLVDRLNRITNSPTSSYIRGEDGSLKACIGNFHINHAYGGVTLHRMCNEGGGVSDVLSRGHMPKRELYELICAFIRGIEFTSEE